MGETMTSREAFEAVFAPQRFRMRKERGEYMATDTETAWLGWQAATERAALIAEADHYGEWLAAAIRGEA